MIKLIKVFSEFGFCDCSGLCLDLYISAEAFGNRPALAAYSNRPCSYVPRGLKDDKEIILAQIVDWHVVKR